MSQGTPWVMTAALISWSGFFLHNYADLPGQTILSPETLYPTLVYLALIAAWFLKPIRNIAAWALFGWALLHLVGGAIISVLPLPFLPFNPEQTLRHYMFHAIYGVLQIPLVAMSLTWRPGRSAAARRA